MKIFWKKIMIITLAVVMLCTSILPQNVLAAESTYSINWNFNKQNIILNGYYNTRYQAANAKYYASTPQITSFWDADGNYNVVCGSLSNEIYINRYDGNLNFLNTITISKELNLFGNAICDGNYYYIVWGQNDDQNENCTVICLAKYSLDGKKIACCDLKGYDSIYNQDDMNSFQWGTKYPFDSGSVSLSTNSGIISCIYARKMYNDIQSNYCFYVNSKDMTRLDSNAVVYCSDSYDQTVLAASDGGFLYVNQGDKEHRAFKIDYVDSTRNNDYSKDIFHFREGANQYEGYKQTYAQLGGVIETDKGFIFCGSSEKTLSSDNAETGADYYGHSEARNLFVQALKKDFYKYNNADMFYVSGEERKLTGTKLETSSTELYLPDDVTDYGVKWLTDYDDSYYVNNPKVLVTDDNKVIVLWEKLSYSTHEGSTYFEILDEDLNVIQSASKLNNVYLPGNANLTYHDNKIIWVTSDKYGQYINYINLKYDDSALADATATLKNYSVSLPGNIDLNCYLEISDALINDSSAYVSFTNTNTAKETKVPLSTLENTGDTYKVTYSVAAAQMNDDINVQVICRSHTYDKSVISVARYTRYVLEHQNENDEYKKAVPLVKAMLNYGGYAQTYFNYYPDKLVNNGIYTSSTDPVLTKNINTLLSDTFDYNNLTDISSNMYKISDENDVLKYKGASLTCDFDTKLNLYFDIKSQDFSYENYKKNAYQTLYYITSTDIGGMYTYSSYATDLKDGKMCFSINNIPAQNLDRVFLLDIWTYGSNEEIVYPYSPMTYIFKAANSENKNLSNLVKSMYWYYDAAKTYTK